jgi:hypothetical protein
MDNTVQNRVNTIKNTNEDPVKYRIAVSMLNTIQVRTTKTIKNRSEPVKYRASPIQLRIAMSQ